MTKHARALALTAATLPLMAAPAMASQPFDPRALALGGHYTAYCNSDVNGTLVNPALLQYQRGTLYIGPNLGFTLGTDTVSPLDIYNDQTNVQNYVGYVNDYFGYGTKVLSDPTAPPPATPVPFPSSLNGIVTKGLTLDLGLRSGLVGLKVPFPSLLGVKEPADPNAKKSVTTSTSTSGMITSKGDIKVSTTTSRKEDGPKEPGLAWGALGVRAWMDTSLDLQLSSPTIMNFMVNFPSLDQTLKGDIQGFKDQLESNTVSPSSLVNQVGKIRSDITSPSGFGMLLAGGQALLLKETNRVYGTGAVTLSQPIPFPTLPFFPRAKATLGGSFKVFAAPGNLNTLIPQLQSNPAIPTLGAPGSLKAEATIDLKDPLTTLDSALNDFSQDYTKVGDLSSKLGAFGNLDYNKAISMKITARSASSMGFGADFGLNVDLSPDLSVGAAVLNPIVLWPGTEVVQASGFDANHQPTFTQVSSTNINFNDTEPTAFSLGASYHLPLGFTVMGDLQQTMEQDLSGNLYGPSAQGGVEWNIFNLLYARAGARVGGKDPLYGAGVGLNLFLAHVDLGLGADPSLKAVNVAASLGVGF